MVMGPSSVKNRLYCVLCQKEPTTTQYPIQIPFISRKKSMATKPSTRSIMKTGHLDIFSYIIRIIRGINIIFFSSTHGTGKKLPGRLTGNQSVSIIYRKIILYFFLLYFTCLENNNKWKLGTKGITDPGLIQVHIVLLNLYLGLSIFFHLFARIKLGLFKRFIYFPKKKFKQCTLWGTGFLGSNWKKMKKK